jgi:hypothetical protein
VIPSSYSLAKQTLKYESLVTGCRILSQARIPFVSIESRYITLQLNISVNNTLTMLTNVVKNLTTLDLLSHDPLPVSYTDCAWVEFDASEEGIRKIYEYGR